MQLADWYHVNKNKWWLLPLILPSILLPLVSLFNASGTLEESRIALYYLSPALMMALMMIFGWAAVPGVTLSILVHYLPERGLVDAVTGVFHYLLPLSISWGGYKVFAQHRSTGTFGNLKLTPLRLFWLIFCNTTLFFVFYQVAIFFGLYDVKVSLLGENPLQISTLINYQGILVGSITGVPFCYFLIRVIRKPNFFRAFIYRMRAQFHQSITAFEVGGWIFLLCVLLALLLIPLSDNSNIFNTNYTFTLILPLMLWGAMRFGYLFITTVWTSILILLSHYFYRYVPHGGDYKLQLAITSSCYAVFSISITLMAIVTTRQREVYARAKRMALLDPIIQIPNLRAMTRDLKKHTSSALCFLSIPGLELLGRNYGVMLRINYKQQLSSYLRQYLDDDEFVYQLSGHELVIRLNGESHREHIEFLHSKIKMFRLHWDEMPLQPQVGISFCYVRPPVEHLYLLLGELGTAAGFALTTNMPESLHMNGVRHIQYVVRSKVAMLNRLQNALDNDHFFLMAQPIKGIRGDIYYELLLRMEGEDNVIYTPDQFLPVAHEFGLSTTIDMWVLENALQFIDSHRDTHPGMRFSINLTPASVCRAQLPEEIRGLLKIYNVEPWQLVLEITESDQLTNIEQATVTLHGLQSMGCRVAIDDFGTGYASYARLREMHADIMKIDGSFIRNLMTSSLDYQIVESIFQLARMKRMQVVAEYVENEETAQALTRMGVDYQQGYFVGRPQSLRTLFQS